MKKLSRLLVARTDKLGDVLMSMPALKLLRDQLPETQVSFLCRQGPLEAVAPLLKKWNIPVLPYADFNVRIPWIYFEAALFLYDDPKALFGSWKAGTRLRVGNRSKPLSQLALHHGLRQHRSLSEKSEAEYNLDLAKLFLKVMQKEGPFPFPAPEAIPPEPIQEDFARALLAKLGFTQPKSFILVHPGMAGSALNPSVSHYVKVIRALVEQHQKPVLLSQGPIPKDKEFVDGILKELPDLKVAENVAMGIFREVLRQAALVVAPSTGPLHLAHWVGTPTAGLFSPVRTHRPMRWAPIGSTGVSKTYVPAVDCPGTKDCLGSKCKMFPCMENTDWARLLLG